MQQQPKQYRVQSITADYTERIIIPPEDVIPKSSWFRFVKCSLIIALSLLIVMAILTLIVAESLTKPQPGPALGIISLLGIILFFVGLIAIAMEHIPTILAFTLAVIIYLLIFMYSRVITSPGLIILRSLILVLLTIESFCFAIMIRDWRQIQISRLNHRVMKETGIQYGITPAMSPPSMAMISANPYANPYSMQQPNPYDQADMYGIQEQTYQQIGPAASPPNIIYTPSNYYQ